MKNYFEKWSTNHLLALQSAERAERGFEFVEILLDKKSFLRQEVTTAPYSRQINVLISYNFELLLDSAVLICSEETDEQKLINRIKDKINHNLLNLWKLIDDKEIIKILDINVIKPRKENFFRYYDVKMNNETILTISDFKNIRYDINDFRKKENTNLRMPKNESESMDLTVDTLKKISKKITSFLWNKYSPSPSSNSTTLL